MEYRENVAITDAGKDIACSCIKSEELREHMRKYMHEPEAIIAGSLKSLDEKLTMLEQLRKEAPRDRTEEIDSYLAQLNSALEMLRNVERDRGILLVSAMFYSEEDRGPDTFDGPFPAASLEATQRFMERYIEENPDDDWSESYWQIDLYTSEDLHEHQAAQPSLSFAATKDGELVFLRDERNRRTRRAHIENLWRNESRRFCASVKNIYTPWVPGDILKIDGRPFDHGPRFAIVLENDFEHIPGQIWCAGPSANFGAKDGALATGTYQDGFMNAFTPSVLYTVELYTGDLPDNCAFMLELSKKLRDDPDYGKQWSKGALGNDCLQPYRTPFNQSERDIRPEILEFLDSRAIKGYLLGIDYELTTPAAAFIVMRSHWMTLRQKLEGWQKILDNMPNCTIVRKHGAFFIPDFHAFLRNVIKQEHRRVALFKKGGSKSMFFFEDYTEGHRHPEGRLYGPYSSYEKCFGAIWEEFEGNNPALINIIRRRIDSDGTGNNEGSTILNAHGEILACFYICKDAWEEGGDVYDFESMWFDIPIPFSPGEIVYNLQCPERSFLSRSICRPGTPDASKRNCPHRPIETGMSKRLTGCSNGTVTPATQAT